MTTSAPYLWSDLVARRSSLGLTREEVASTLGVDLSRYRSRETGAQAVGHHLMDELIAMEAFVASITQAHITTGREAPRITVSADQAAFEGRYPRARTGWKDTPYPVTLEYTAAGRAAAALRREGIATDIHRAGRAADVLCRRLATGLVRPNAVELMRISKKHYQEIERGTRHNPRAVVEELQNLDDFLTTAAEALEPLSPGPPVVLPLIDDQQEFEARYPEAHLADGAPWPSRVSRVIALRAASRYATPDHPARTHVIGS